MSIVYVLINEAMPGFVKIGKTEDLAGRIRGLDNTSVPLPFECFYAARVADAGFVEKQLHDAFGDQRIRSNREFFQLAPERIASALRIAQIEDVTPGNDIVESEEDQRALDKERQRRANFNFSMVEIQPGAELTFINDESITCTVESKTKINFEGEITSLSQAAGLVLSRLGKNWRSAAGPRYWEFEGETLAERRNRFDYSEEE
jgi:hypothetical protein